MDKIKESLLAHNIDDAKACLSRKKSIFAGWRLLYRLLEALIGPDAKIYACCGVQYALEKPSMDLPEELCLGSAADIDNIMKKQCSIDGTICVKCYYMSYNILLKGLLKELAHKEFI